jgi:hypothetical protein
MSTPKVCAIPLSFVVYNSVRNRVETRYLVSARDEIQTAIHIFFTEAALEQHPYPGTTLLS